MGFKIGDVVQLKSGGPRMTVTGFGVGGDTVTCAWFEGTQPRQDSYLPAALRESAERFELFSLDWWTPHRAGWAALFICLFIWSFVPAVRHALFG
jgi:uncharacterized protein YodC (DUF2158 family)